jgi:mannosyltransferase OCH1-like enzyme
MVYIENLERRNNIPILNKYELINDSIYDIHHVIYYIDDYKFNIILRRLDEPNGWDIDLKIVLYSKDNNNSQIISLGSSEKNYKKINIISKIKLYNLYFINQLIPKVIVQTTYNRDIQNILHYNSILTYIELNPEYEYKIFDNNDSRLFIKNNFDDNTLIAYDLIIPGAFKADFFRYCYLYINGGCYFDCKSILRIPLRDIIKVDDIFILCKDIDEGYFNAVILSIKKNELLLKTINMCINNIYNFYNKYNFKKNIYNNVLNMLSFTGPVLIYNAIKDDINDNCVKFIHKYANNKKNNFKHDYHRLFIEYNSKIIITKQYNSYVSSSGNHYSNQWYNKEVIYESCFINNKIKYKFYKFMHNLNDKFDFYIISNKKFIIERIDNNSGWDDILRIKIINEVTNKELLLNIGSSNESLKIINLDCDFFSTENIIKKYSFYNNICCKKFSISISKNRYNIDKLIIINNENTGWNENIKLNILLYNNNEYNIDIGNSDKNIKIINFN